MAIAKTTLRSENQLSKTENQLSSRPRCGIRNDRLYCIEKISQFIRLRSVRSRKEFLGLVEDDIQGSTQSRFHIRPGGAEPCSLLVAR